MNHSIFGEIKYEYLWKGDYSINLFDVESIGLLNISGEENEEIELIQIEAFKAFETKKQEMCKEIEKALFSYYSEVNDEYRDRYGVDADNFAPKINTQEEMKSLITFESLNLPYSFTEGERVVGILFKSKWEIEHGVAVKLVNEKIAEVGYQDIVL